MLVNKSAIKNFIIKKLESMRPQLKITRISNEAIQKYECLLMNTIVEDINQHPTMGKTFKP